MINFNVPPFTGKESEYMMQAVKNEKICGDGTFTKKCSRWMEEKFTSNKVLLTTSCTSAIELSALLLDIKEGDEVICPSFTFVSTVNPFVLRGAKIKFVDIRPDTMNIDENKIEAAITSNTKAIVVVHYAGVSCEMSKVMEIAWKYKLAVVEDAAQGVMSKYNDKYLGTIGDFGCYSFHETKNYSMGEGGAFLVQNQKLAERAEIIREKGTNRAQFFRGQVDKYTWQDMGSSYLPSDMLAAYLWAQLELAEEINQNRLKTWNKYYSNFKFLAERGKIDLPSIPTNCTHNAHMFYIKCKDLSERTELIQYLKKNEILAVFHYIPLHSSPAGLKYGEFVGEDTFTTKESERLVRLPLYYQIDDNDLDKVIRCVKEFYND
ncbi:dTDP-4-amino-4,6-dideoxygalactose transaminase [Anaerorhabdus furcosa]|uniref:dTDP-4-amino-4,6-dideoxygalactose transaminase n=1 Tax=Anaerorhabdus furcosa TaxID=118967 RepID=A0A1T4LUJ0_9FIRM|nr:dTDP-4-amino-4,6-dideoxygalactose transaminase [Anaerorhabdus furcosa]SJZ58390.1 dTDP-4-amino-4,6-dideoxygalactose transaminase [Anaerorhabdus furcosa]